LTSFSVLSPSPKDISCSTPDQRASLMLIRPKPEIDLRTREALRKRGYNGPTHGNDTVDARHFRILPAVMIEGIDQRRL